MIKTEEHLKLLEAEEPEWTEVLHDWDQPQLQPETVVAQENAETILRQSVEEPVEQHEEDQSKRQVDKEVVLCILH